MGRRSSDPYHVISPEAPLILASASPRRREILAGLGLPFRVVAAEIDEPSWNGETPTEYVRQMAEAKLEAVAPRVRGTPHSAVLAADTVVVIDGQVLGKPRSVVDARRLLGQLVGRSHNVFTSYVLAGRDGPQVVVAWRTVSTLVTMRSASRDEIERYAHTGEGLDKAGAYAAQGIGAFLVERIAGSYSCVVGLPACELILDLRRNGLLGPYP